jgi:hypothetical protein
VNGTFNSLYDLSEGTIFGPFGRPAAGGPSFSDLQAAAAANFHDGSSELDVVQSITSGDVVCLAMVERNITRIGDDDEARRWVLPLGRADDLSCEAAGRRVADREIGRGVGSRDR